MMCSATLPGFSIRCVAPIGMYVDSFSDSRKTLSLQVIRAVPDPDSVRETGRVFRPGRLHRLVERVRQKRLAGLRLDRHEPAPVLRLQHGLQLLDVDPPSTVDDRLCFG